LGPGDLLIIYSDGVTELPNAKGEEYKEERLPRVVQKNQSRPVYELMTLVQENLLGIRQFNSLRRHTAIIAGCH